MHNFWLLTHNLEFLAASKCLSRLEVRSLRDLGRRLDCKVTEEWRQIVPLEIAEFFATRLSEHSEDVGWWNWYGVTLEPERVLAVTAGFKGWPDEGKVWIGYSVAPEFRGRGLATEAVKTLCEWAFNNGVLTVGAQTDEANYPSRRVLEKCGFTQCHSYQDANGGQIMLQFERHISNWN